MTTLASRVMLVLTLGGLIGLGCKQSVPNSAPTITSFTLPDTVFASNEETLSCTASDPDGDPLAYDWTCSAGSLLPRTSATVVWATPDSSGTATIAVTVTDDSGASDTKTGTVVIKPVTETIIDWNGSVDSFDVQLWTRSYIPAGYTVSGSFSVDAHDITFLVLDSINYESWRFLQTYNAVVKVERSPGSGFSGVIPAGGPYHFVLDNSYNPYTDSSAHLVVRQTSP